MLGSLWHNVLTSSIESAKQPSGHGELPELCAKHLMVTNQPDQTRSTAETLCKGHQPPELNLCAPRFVYSLYVETISLSTAGADLNGREVDL